MPQKDGGTPPRSHLINREKKSQVGQRLLGAEHGEGQGTLSHASRVNEKKGRRC